MLAAGHLLYGHSASRGVGLDDTESRVVATFDWILAQAVGNTRTVGEVDMNLVGGRGDLHRHIDESEQPEGLLS